MQCGNCHFENLPGSAACGRCGSVLQAGGVAVSVHPPRARPVQKTLRRILPLRRVVVKMSDAVRAVLVRLPRVPIPQGELLRVGVRLPVPGWPQLYLRQRRRGRVLLWTFLGLFVPGLLIMGGTLGMLLIGLAFSVHVMGVLDVMNSLAPRPGILPQFARSLAVSLMLLALLYLPAVRLVGTVADPRTIMMSSGPLERGDVVLVNHYAYARSRPRVGDVVLYNLPRGSWGTRNANGQAVNYIYQGDGIDRILAAPGDHVLWEEGRLLVNGELSSLRPLNPSLLPSRIEIDVPEGHYLVFPTMTPNLQPHTDLSVWVRLSCVPRERIAGRAYLRSMPPWRIRTF